MSFVGLIGSRGSQSTAAAVAVVAACWRGFENAGKPSAQAIQGIPGNHRILENVVSPELPMALRIRHNQVAEPPACPLSQCMRLLRGAWAPNVIWYLSAHPRRFGELRVDMPKISARVLS